MWVSGHCLELGTCPLAHSLNCGDAKREAHISGERAFYTEYEEYILRDRGDSKRYERGVNEVYVRLVPDSRPIFLSVGVLQVRAS